MNDLIKITYDNDRPTVSGRELYEFLDYDKSQWARWYKKNIEEDPLFAEGIDYVPLDIMSNGNMTKDFQLTIEMAKELSMLARNEKGKQARQYFINLEKAWNTPEAIMSRALRMADEQLKMLKIVNSELTVSNTIMAPKADYFDQLVDRNLLTNFRETAKQLGIREKEFMAFLYARKYIYRDQKGKIQPYADKNNGLFELKETFNEKTQWSGTQTLITPKGRETFRLLCVGI
ncbi:Phage antirepressor protein YoqD, KilAC domain [Sporobacter termitidis DSM 10068]|uniref:Phage antirepressor protein YoqD, KilAC domain n=1 Tax=Sporobacter termitidis DSM 10068 TaxID=1123282 RepID=A0A1M5ZI55_9FIRM|nr:phage antirepressor KilAC domain-containing protein [Sporobacter termitidis]SHI23838.1 Phage antirepressor protein YoqD, KilAC domain [Sporobacter termitidis DSM 10068]